MGGRKRNKDQFNASAVDNNLTFRQYLDRLTELSISMFEWRNLPTTVDARYLELQLFETGCMVYFDDDVIGNACLNCLYNGQFDIYGNPTTRRAYSKYNNYQKELNQDDSVVIWNNYLHTNSIMQVRQYAFRLYNLDRIIDVNANAQKTPVLVQATEKQRLTMLNLYKEYDGNAPFIFGDRDIDFQGLKAISTGAPYICDKIYQLKTQIWNEALTYLGISNINIQKKERLITDEVTRNQGGTIASRYSRLESRREAVKKINEMFGTNIEVNYREDFQQVDNDILPDDTGADTIGGTGNE
jgi:hypothetical protein